MKMANDVCLTITITSQEWRLAIHYPFPAKDPHTHTHTHTIYCFFSDLQTSVLLESIDSIIRVYY